MSVATQSPAIMLAEIVHRAKLVDIAKRNPAQEEITGEEDGHLGRALRDLGTLAELTPEMAPAIHNFKLEIGRIRRRYAWECMECGALYNDSEEMLRDEGLPTCPGCNSQDYEPN